MGSITRRTVLKSSLLAGAAALPARGLSLPTSGGEGASEVLPLTSTSGVFTPPRGRSFYKFSFDFPEPSVEFGGYQFSVRVFTYENTYALDAQRMRVERSAEAIAIHCDGLLWAGGQEKSEGAVSATVRQGTGGLEFEAAAVVPNQRIKSIAVIVRGLPRGEVSKAASNFFDPHDDEVLAAWPDLNAGLPSPIVVIRTAEKYTSVSLAAKPDTARTTRFYLQPGAQSYRAELLYEREAWTSSDRLDTPTWHIRTGTSYEAVAAPHYAHVEKAFGVPTWEERTDVPAWMKKVSLVVSIHGAHWTGYIMNTYARQLNILRWIATKIDPARVLVFLPAWDGRYYWNYPAYEPDPRMGGTAGFKRLISESQKLGFHMVPMFGSNVANKDVPAFNGVRDAVTIRPGRDEWNLDYVDWDNDRRGDANYGFMNLGVTSWRKHLESRIADVLGRYGADGYFLDIVGCAENNTQGDMSLGTRGLVKDLRRQFPGKLAIGEMHYDALLDSIAVYHADNTPAYPAAFYRYGRMFEHLSWPAPGRGSTGVHEAGFSGRGKLPTVDQRVIPTLTVVDDTFSRYRDEMEQVIEVGKKWQFPGLPA